MEVEYREIPGHPDYRVGNDGSFWSRRNGSNLWGRTEGWRRVEGSLTKKGYVLIRMGKKLYLIHRLVLEAFVGCRPPGMECRHLNGVKTDNRLSNICWGTPLENAADRIRLGEFQNRANMAKGENHGRAVLTGGDVTEIRRLRQLGHSQYALGRRFGVSRRAIQAILEGHTWKHVS